MTNSQKNEFTTGIEMGCLKEFGCPCVLLAAFMFLLNCAAWTFLFIYAYGFGWYYSILLAAAAAIVIGLLSVCVIGTLGLIVHACIKCHHRAAKDGTGETGEASDSEMA